LEVQFGEKNNTDFTEISGIKAAKNVHFKPRSFNPRCTDVHICTDTWEDFGKITALQMKAGSVSKALGDLMMTQLERAKPQCFIDG